MARTITNATANVAFCVSLPVDVFIKSAPEHYKINYHDKTKQKQVIFKIYITIKLI